MKKYREQDIVKEPETLTNLFLRLIQLKLAQKLH